MKRGRCAAPGSEGSEDGGGGWRRRLGPTTSAGCVEGGDGPSGRGWWYRRFAAMSMKSALRDLLLVSLVLHEGER